MKTNYKSTILSGLIRRNFLEDFPGSLLLSKNTDYKLIVTSPNLILLWNLIPSSNNQCNVYLPFYSGTTGINATVYWDNDNSESIIFNDKNQLHVISHTYTNITELISQHIKISGTFLLNNTINSSINYYNNDNGYLYKVLSWGENEYETLNGMFANAINLIEIPNEIMPDTNYAIKTFYNCTNLSIISEQFELSNILLNATSMFENTNINDTSLNNIKFNNNLACIDRMFYGCTNITKKPTNFYNRQYFNVNYMTKKDNSLCFVETSIENPEDILKS